MNDVVMGDRSASAMATDSERYGAPREALPSVVIVAGKGGVGKSTVTAALARSAFRLGLRVLVVDVDHSGPWSRLLPEESRQDASGPMIEIAPLAARDLLEEYLGSRRLGGIARRLRSSGVLEVVATAAPGIEDLVVLGKIRQMEASGRWDLILVDAPASGHALTMLTSPEGVAAAVTAGPLRTQAEGVLEMVRDPRRCMVMLVTIAEATPVNEVIETAFVLEDRVGVQLGPVIVNRVDHVEAELMDLDLDVRSAEAARIAAGRFRQQRARSQQTQLARLVAELPLTQISLPLLPTAALDAAALDGLADVLAEWVGRALKDRAG